MKPTSQPEATVKPQRSSNAGQKRILLAEDDKDMRDLLCEVLEMQEYVVISAASGQEAVEKAENQQGAPIDLLISDLVMPGMGGLQLAAWFRKRFPEVGILIISGYTDDMLIMEESLSQNTHFLPKPLRVDTFKDAVAELLPK